MNKFFMIRNGFAEFHRATGNASGDARPAHKKIKING